MSMIEIVSWNDVKQMKLLFTALAALYILWPKDLLPDFLIGWGWLDDLLVALCLWYLYRRFKRPAAHHSAGRPSDYHSGVEGAHDLSSDPFEILELEQNASLEEIKQAYRRLANRYHPDKVAHLGPEFQELAARRFRAIQKAYEEIAGSEPP